MGYFGPGISQVIHLFTYFLSHQGNILCLNSYTLLVAPATFWTHTIQTTISLEFIMSFSSVCNCSHIVWVLDVILRVSLLGSRVWYPCCLLREFSILSISNSQEPGPAASLCFSPWKPKYMWIFHILLFLR